METNERVQVRSCVGGTVGFTLPELRFKRTWTKKGMKLPIPKDILREAIYNPGVEYLFKNGLLYIDDMEFKKELGLEPEDATQPTNIIPLDDKLIERLVTKMPIGEFKIEFKKLAKMQQEAVVNWAIEHEALDVEKGKVMQAATGVDLLRAVTLKRQNEEVTDGDKLPKSV